MPQMKEFARMLKYFYKETVQSMSNLGLSGTVTLLAYPNRTINDNGLTTLGEPVEYEIRGVFVPMAAHGIGRMFGMNMNREPRGQYFTGYNYLFVDEKWLKDNSIVIDVDYDRVQYNADQFKIMRMGEFKHYHMVSMYLCERVDEVFEE